jgi:hypothetical protein
MSDALMWAGFGKGLADAGSTMASFLMKAETAREDREARMTLRREELAYREANDLANREFRESQNALYKKAVGAGGSSGGGGGKGGIALEDLSPGGKAESIIAMNSGMTLPDYQRFRKANETGDFSGYAVDTPRFGREPAPGTEGLGAVGGEFSDAVSRKASTLTEETIKQLPPGFKEYADAKRKQIGAIIESYALGPAFDDVQKGRQTGLITSIGEKAYTNPETAPVGGQAVAVMGGKPLANVEGGMLYNQYTGKSEVTPVGQSQITENVAKAGEATAKGAAAETKAERLTRAKRETTADLQRQVDNSLAILHENLGVNKNEANAELARLQKNAVTNPQAAEKLRKLEPFIADVTAAREELKKWKAQPASTSETPAPKAETPPSISAVKDAPAGSSIGIKTDKGWEVKDKNGKLIGYTRK